MTDAPDPASQSALVAGALAGPIESIGDVWNALIGDRLATWRFTNAMHSAKRAREEAERLGLKLSSERIPNRFTVAWFEEASKCDEEDLRDMFARLLARAASDDAPEVQPDRRLAGLISGMSPTDAKVFNVLYSGDHFPSAEGQMPGYGVGTLFVHGRGVNASALARVAQSTFGQEGVEAVETLLSSGLISSRNELDVSGVAGAMSRSLGSRSTASFDRAAQKIKVRTELFPTLLGHRLYRATKAD